MIDAGTLALTGSGSIAASSGVMMTGGTFDISQGANQSVKGLSSTGGAGTVALGANTLTITGEGTSFSGSLTNGGIGGGTGGGLTIGDGAAGASLSLSGTNTYSGATTINTGSTLFLTGGATVASTSGFALAGTGADLDISGMTGSAIIKNLSGVAGTTVTLGDRQLIAGALVDTTFAGVIQGAGRLTKQASGTLTLSGVNTYSGNTSILQGTLALSDGGSIAASSRISLGGPGTVFDISQTTSGTSVSNLQSASGVGTVAIGGKTLTLTGNANETFGGAIVDGGIGAGIGGALTIGNGTSAAHQTLSGTNIYTGATTINAGSTLSLSDTGSIANSSGVTLTGANARLDLTGMTIGTTIKDLTGGATSSVALGANALTVGTANSTTFAGVIGGGTGGLVKQGSGTLTLSGANSYSGTTTISGGALQVGNGGTTGTLGTGSVVNNASLLLNRSDTMTISNAISGSGSVTQQGTGTTILTGANSYTGGTVVSGGTLQGNATSLQGNITNNAAVVFDQAGTGTYAGAMTGTGSLTKQNTGTLILTGTNSYGGGTTISGGTLQIGNGGTTGSITGDVVNNGTLAFNRSDDVTFAGLISGNGGLTKLGANTLILTSDNSYSGLTTISGGTLQLGNGGTTGSIAGNVVNNGVLAFNRSDNVTFGGDISGIGSIAYLGSGTVTLTGTNTSTGATVLGGGVVQVGSGGALGAGDVVFAGGTLQATASFTVTQPVILNTGGGTVDSAGNTVTFSAPVTGSGGLTKAGTGSLVLEGDNNYTGGTTITGGTLQLGTGGTTGSITGNVLNDGALAFNRSDVVTFGGAISGTGSVQQAGTGTTILTGANTYSGGTTVTAGILQGTTTSLQGAIANNAAVVFDQATNGTYAGIMSGSGGLTKSGTGNVTLAGANTYSGGTTVTGGTLTGTTTSLQGAITNNATVVFDQATNGTYAGAMSGTGGLMKSGTGNVTLSGANSYSGGTTVAGGTLTGTTASLQGAIANNAAVVFDQSTNGTYAGIMSGTGGLTKSGTGNVTLSGANTYSGGTTVTGGTLTGTTTSLQGAIANNAAVVFDQATDGTYAGVMSGTGGLTNSGTGNVTLSGANSYSGGTTVTGGTLTGTTTSLQGAIANNATVVFDQATDGTYAGAMSGTGGLTKTGTGNVILSGANTYSGGTTVSEGVLQGTTTSLQGNIVNNSLVVIDQSTNGTYAGNMSGTGTFTKTGSGGTLILSGANTYSGGTNVNVGTLQGDTTSLQGNIANNAAVVFDQATAGTYAGTMTGTGSVTKSGTGNVTLSGNNSYTGGTIVSGGTLTGTTASLIGNILNDATVAFDQAVAGTYAGVISGTGAVTKMGAGLLNITGAQTYSDTTSVTGGTLAVNGSLVGGVVVGPGGTIGGIGMIAGLTMNGGTLAPGNSIGTLTVAGNYVQNGGFYQVEANSAGQSDRLNATGTATLNGGIVQVLAQPGTYARNTTYTIINATGGVTGAYAGVTSNFAFLTPSLSYDASNVYLLLFQPSTAFAAGAQSANQFAVGTALDIASPSVTSGDFNTVLDALAALSTAQGPAALSAISGQPYSGFGTANVAGNLLFMNGVAQQIATARTGQPGSTRVALAEACETACDSAEPTRWGAWMTGLGGTGNVGGNANAGTLSYNFGGVAVGVDYRFDPRFLVGATVGYASGRQWVGGFQGVGWTDSYTAALYASFTEGGFYADGLVGYAYANNTLQRSIVIPGLAARTATGTAGVNQFLGQVEAGYRFGLYAPAAASVAPFARFQTVAASQNAFTESGANSLNLNVAQQNTTSVRTVLGADLAAAIPVGPARTFDVALRLGWAHEYASTTRPVTASFAGAATVPFTVYGAQPQRDAAVIGLGLTTQIANGASVYARYDGEITGRDDAHVFSAGLRMTW